MGVSIISVIYVNITESDLGFVPSVIQILGPLLQRLAEEICYLVYSGHNIMGTSEAIGTEYGGDDLPGTGG